MPQYLSYILFVIAGFAFAGIGFGITGRKSVKSQKKANKLREYSKCIIALMTAFWFAGGIFAAVVIWRSGTEVAPLLTYIGEPMTVGILGYLLKSAFENREKIKKSPEQPAEEVNNELDCR